MRHWLLILVTLGTSALLLLGAAWYHAGRLAAPAHMSVGEPPPWFDAEQVEFASASGARIHGWFMPVANAQAGVVLLHPVRGNRRSMLGRARFLAEAGCMVLLIDLQAHGESLGKHISFGYLESRDAMAAVEFLRGRFHGGPIVVLGTSLGGAAALLARPPLPVDGLILEAVFPSIEQAIANRLHMRAGILGAKLTPLLLWQIAPRLGIEAADLRPVDAARSISAEVFIMAGAADRRTTPDDTELLYDAFNSRKQLWFIPGAGHENLHQFAQAEYERQVLAFIGGLGVKHLQQAIPGQTKPERVAETPDYEYAE